ncbi:MAG: DUF721 domain-containing protein [Bacteroidales bacterium]|nr:DUF721 domain-containing protein [Bacteroidales bacterium]
MGRDSNEFKLGDALKQMLKTYKLEGRMKETHLINSWGKVVGRMIDQHTSNLYIKNKTLFVRVDSAALRNELAYAKTKLINALNKEAGGEVIVDIVLR